MDAERELAREDLEEARPLHRRRCRQPQKVGCRFKYDAVGRGQGKARGVEEGAGGVCLSVCLSLRQLHHLQCQSRSIRVPPGRFLHRLLDVGHRRPGQIDEVADNRQPCHHDFAVEIEHVLTSV